MAHFKNRQKNEIDNERTNKRTNEPTMKKKIDQGMYVCKSDKQKNQYPVDNIR